MSYTMKYTIIPLTDADHSYKPVDSEITFTDDIGVARTRVREGFDRHGIVPDVLVGGKKAWLFSDAEVGRWAMKRAPRPGVDTGEDLA